MIEKLLPPILVEGIWSFLRHAGFYQMCIKDFSKISKCICNVLEKDTIFHFFEECLIETLKEKLILPFVLVPGWSLSFHLIMMQETVVGTVLG